mmetsp:Transcript_42889/g.135303  ORF Transcript_42889/g.135303 Transcript_42889/m.135303 type:complete len:124 (+) Transcript_42889:107-478(+)
MPYPDPRDLTNASVGSSVRPRAAMRDLRASQTLTVNREMSISGDALRVYPAEVEFKDTSPNVPHILTMTIMNKSDHVKRVRLVQPKLKEFKLHHIPTVCPPSPPPLPLTAPSGPHRPWAGDQR